MGLIVEYVRGLEEAEKAQAGCCQTDVYTWHAGGKRTDKLVWRNKNTDITVTRVAIGYNYRTGGWATIKVNMQVLARNVFVDPSELVIVNIPGGCSFGCTITLSFETNENLGSGTGGVGYEIWLWALEGLRYEATARLWGR